MPTNKSNPVASDAPEKTEKNGKSKASSGSELGAKVLEFLKWARERSSSATYKTILFFVILFGAGAFVTYKATKSYDSYHEAGMIGLGAMALGFLVGFLFGIPRSPGSEGEGVDVGGPEEEHEEVPDPGRRSVGTGSDRPTNLEDISDWLSKVLIGAGLVGLKDGVIYLRGMAGKISTEIGGEAAGLESFAMALMIYFFSLGLLFSYIVTRIYLTTTFADARWQMLVRAERRAERENQPEAAKFLRSMRG